MKKKLALSLLSLAFPVDGSALTIDNVRISDSGRSIVIQGSGFGQKPNVAVYDTFDPQIFSGTDIQGNGSLSGSKISRRAAELGRWSFGSYTGRYNDDAYSGSYSAQLYRGRIGMQQVIAKFEPSQEVFVSYWVKLSGGRTFPGDYVDGPEQFSSDSSWKFSWLIDRDYHGRSSDVSLPTHVGGGNFYLAGNDFNMVEDLGNDWWSWNEWIRLSFWLKADDINPTSSGSIQFQTRSIDNGYQLRNYNTPIFDDDGPSRKAYRQINFPGWIRSLKDNDTNVVYDDIYVAYGSNAVSRVEIANDDNYNDADKIYILPQEEWSRNEITVKTLDLLKNDISSMYVYVTDSNGNVNQKGIPLGSPAPSPITNIGTN